MPIGPLVLFGGVALLIAFVFAAFLMPPQKVLEKLWGKSKKNQDSNH